MAIMCFNDTENGMETIFMRDPNDAPWQVLHWRDVGAWRVVLAADGDEVDCSYGIFYYQPEVNTAIPVDHFTSRVSDALGLFWSKISLLQGRCPCGTPMDSHLAVMCALCEQAYNFTGQ